MGSSSLDKVGTVAGFRGEERDNQIYFSRHVLSLPCEEETVGRWPKEAGESGWGGAGRRGKRPLQRFTQK